MKKSIIILLWLIFLGLLSCSNGGNGEMEPSFWGQEDDYFFSESKTERAVNPVSKDLGGADYEPEGPAAVEEQVLSKTNASVDSREDENSSDNSNHSNNNGDKKIYTGYQKLRVADVEEVKSLVISKTEDVGGYVESLFATYMVLRVPKASFTDCFNTFMNLGEVLNKSIQTFDVSEYFQDLSLRLDISSRARARLYILLEKTNDVEERLRILKEINRLSEEIEAIRLRLDSLTQLIAYSKITLELVPRLTESNNDMQKSTIPFEWIAKLDAFHVSIPKMEGDMKIELSGDFAVFKEDKYFHAETAQGTVFRAGTVKNFPKGDKDFWQEALYYHLAPYYSSVEKQVLGKFSGVLLKSKDQEPFYYLIALRVHDKKLQIIELMMPDQKSREIYYEQIEVLLKEVK